MTRAIRNVTPKTRSDKFWLAVKGIVLFIIIVAAWTTLVSAVVTIVFAIGLFALARHMMRRED